MGNRFHLAIPAGDLDKAINESRRASAPCLIICNTKIGFGSPNKEGTASSHGQGARWRRETTRGAVGEESKGAAAEDTSKEVKVKST